MCKIFNCSGAIVMHQIGQVFEQAHVKVCAFFMHKVQADTPVSMCKSGFPNTQLCPNPNLCMAHQNICTEELIKLCSNSSGLLSMTMHWFFKYWPVSCTYSKTEVQCHITMQCILFTVQENQPICLFMHDVSWPTAVMGVQRLWFQFAMCLICLF